LSQTFTGPPTGRLAPQMRRREGAARRLLTCCYSVGMFCSTTWPGQTFLESTLWT